MSARVYVHPRMCDVQAVAYGAFLAMLQEQGFDLDTMCIGPASPRGFRQLMRIIGEKEPGVMTYERMDGSRMDYDTRLSAA